MARKKIQTLILVGPLLLAALLLPRVAQAGTFNFCVKGWVYNQDTGAAPPGGVTEDYHITPTDSHYRARGAQVSVYTTSGAFIKTAFTDTGGCTFFSASGSSGTFDIQVHSLSLPGNGNLLRVHDADMQIPGTWPVQALISYFLS